MAEAVMAGGDPVSVDVLKTDVLIVGAGVSGIGAACHLQMQCPDLDWLILEGRDALGGTWDLFRFPGIRSDSDLYTYGYRFKPWEGAPIATAGEIRSYLEETVDEYQLTAGIRFGQRVTRANWSSETGCWTVTVTGKDGSRLLYECNFLWMCTGYYDYEEGYLPEFPGRQRFQGDLVHPQHWPADLDHRGKKLVVIGSGATAVTMLPAMAPEAEQVTMLQRSPSYILSMENSVEITETLRALDVPPEWIHEITRRQRLAEGKMLNYRAKEEPAALREELIAGVRMAIGENCDVDKHFNPRYMPWDERLCLIPDGDLFDAINSGKASVVTDEIQSFTETGIQLKSGRHLDADIIVTATGLNLLPFGKVRVQVDGQEFKPADSWAYRGMMFSGLPNLAWTFGYIRTSWTMRADMIADFVCSLLNHMREQGLRQVTPILRPEDEGMNARSFIDAEDFNPGYMQRSMHSFPRQGDGPWRNSQDYYQEQEFLAQLDLDDGVLVFGSAAEAMAG